MQTMKQAKGQLDEALDRIANVRRLLLGSERLDRRRRDTLAADLERAALRVEAVRVDCATSGLTED